MNGKRWMALLLALAMSFSLFACGAKPAENTGDNSQNTAADGTTRVFTDSCGREVTVPVNVEKIAVSGPLAQIVVFAIAPEMMVGIANGWADEAKGLIPDEYYNLPLLGQLYGGKATLNLEELLATGAEVIIDLGDFKKSIADDLTALQEQTGLPCVFIEADLAHLADAFRTLGTILGKEERGEELARLVEETMTMAAENSAKITEDQQLSVLYSSGSDPLGTNAEGSSQAQVLGIVGAKNAVVLEDVSNKGGGNMINMEQLYNFDPDVVLVTDAVALEIIETEAAWQELRAVKDGRVYTVPCDPYCWLSAPPSMNMILGVWWLGNLLYPEVYDYDMTAKAQEIYKVFWNYDLTAEEAAAMLG